MKITRLEDDSDGARNYVVTYGFYIDQALKVYDGGCKNPGVKKAFKQAIFNDGSIGYLITENGLPCMRLKSLSN